MVIERNGGMMDPIENVRALAKRIVARVAFTPVARQRSQLEVQ
jgi:hypothetical protein